MDKKERLILTFILVLAFFLRFFKLGQNPPSLTWDEAAIGYNAYSILKTGCDEHGRSWPIDNFISFGDYKPPVSIYATVLPTAIFGLNEFSTRFPSALFGTLTVLVSYFLVRELFGKWDVRSGKWDTDGLNSRTLEVRKKDNLSSQKHQKIKSSSSKISHLPRLTSLLLAISPWHILLSRAAFEANLATFFVVLATYFFIRAIKKKGWWLLLSSVSYLISLYTFNTPRLFVPLFLLGLVIIYRSELLKIKKWAVLSAFLGGLLIMPLLPHLFSPEGQLRFKEVNIFTNLDVIKTANRRVDAEGGSLLARIVHNRRIGYGLLFAKHYLDHFNPGYLFFHGDVNPKFSIQDVGQLYLIEAPFLLLGVYFLFKYGKKSAWLVFLWLLTGLVPAGTARETPHALRTLVTLPTWQIIIAFGIYGFYQSLKSKKAQKICYMLHVTCYMLLLGYFLHHYFGHFPQEFSREWQYGYKQTILSISEKDSPLSKAGQGLSLEDYDEILVSDVYGRPYIYFLYYLQYPPSAYQQEAVRERNVFGQYKVKGFDKFKFGNLTELSSQSGQEKVLLIGRPEEMPKEARFLKEIDFLDGSPAFLISEIIL